MSSHDRLARAFALAAALAAFAAVALISGDLCSRRPDLSWRGWAGWWLLAPAAGVFAGVVASRLLHMRHRAVVLGAALVTALLVTVGIWIAGWAVGFGSCAEAGR